MPWSGCFHFGSTFAAYFGPADDNDLHEHAAFQLVVSPQKAVVVVDGFGGELCETAMLIRPMVTHAVQGGGPVALLYLDPCSPIVSPILDVVGSDDIERVAVDRLPFCAQANPDEVMKALRERDDESFSIDPRLAKAIAALGAEPGTVSIHETAHACGVSESRLRVLAREQLGVPLSTWLVWRKLERAAREYAAGSSLAEAAIAGGFADQAHFTRSMRRVFGITPKAAAASLR